MKRIILTLFIAVFAVAASAQGGGHKGHEQIRAQKIAYITDKIELTPAESEKFWPLYNQYWELRRKVGRAKRAMFEQIESQPSGEVQVAALVKLEREEADVIERYAKLFSTVMSNDKVAKFFVAEESFKRFLFENTVDNNRK